MGIYLGIASQAIGLLAASIPTVADGVGDHLAATPFADWVRRPDCHGLMGWEAPGLPESDRWWARCDFTDLPEVPEGFSIAELPKQAPRIAPRCVSGGMVDTLDIGSNRSVQGQLRGLCGA
jgi:hypothetical protein